MARSHPISSKLITWYHTNKRDLPWRKTTDPYKIWLSEIMLQQTQVAQGLSYYIKFTEEFPTVVDLADAPEDKVLLLWQGLGYYSRARNLHTAAKQIKNQFKGKFPTNYNDIRNLKGVGDYTAAAVASIAFNLPHAVVDGNVYRVLSRLFNDNTPINSSAGKKQFQIIADELLNTKEPLLHNSAIMEFGALWCKPQNPKCEECPLQGYCLAFANKTVNQLPVKDKKGKIRNRYFNYFIFNYKDEVYIQKRINKDVWQNLYEFYLIETEQKESSLSAFGNIFFGIKVNDLKIISVTDLPKHVLSHQHIYAKFFEVQLNKPLVNTNLLKLKRADLQDKAFSQLIIKYLSLTK